MAKDRNKRATGEAQWVGTQSVGARLIEGLTDIAESLERGDRIDERFTMRTVHLNLEPRDYSPRNIKDLREQLKASQSVFALLLGVSASAVQSWESGSRPSATARRLMDFMEQNPEPWRQMLRASAHSDAECNC